MEGRGGRDGEEFEPDRVERLRGIGGGEGLGALVAQVEDAFEEALDGLLVGGLGGGARKGPGGGGVGALEGERAVARLERDRQQLLGGVGERAAVAEDVQRHAQGVEDGAVDRADGAVGERGGEDAGGIGRVGLAEGEVVGRRLAGAPDGEGEDGLVGGEAVRDDQTPSAERARRTAGAPGRRISRASGAGTEPENRVRSRRSSRDWGSRSRTARSTTSTSEEPSARAKTPSPPGVWSPNSTAALQPAPETATRAREGERP